MNLYEVHGNGTVFKYANAWNDGTKKFDIYKLYEEQFSSVGYILLTTGFIVDLDFNGSNEVYDCIKCEVLSYNRNKSINEFILN